MADLPEYVGSALAPQGYSDTIQREPETEKGGESILVPGCGLSWKNCRRSLLGNGMVRRSMARGAVDSASLPGSRSRSSPAVADDEECRMGGSRSAQNYRAFTRSHYHTAPRPSRIPQLIPLMRASLSHTWRPSQHVEAAGEETESVQLSGVIGSSPLPPFGVSRPRGVLERGDERSRRAGDGCGVLVLLAPGGS